MSVNRIPRMFTVAEAAAATSDGGAKGISVKTLRREIAAGRLPATRVRGAVRITDTDLTEYLENRRSAA